MDYKNCHVEEDQELFMQGNEEDQEKLKLDSDSSEGSETEK